MALSNQEGHLVLTTGNKSELAVGYSTLYGDSVGGFNPLKDVPEDDGVEAGPLAQRDAAGAGEPPIPENSITKPPSAELRPDQQDSDSLPDYDVLDPILAGYVDDDLGRDDLIAAGHDPALVDRVLRHGRPGRVQAPAVGARPQDLGQGVRPRPPAADHEPVSRRGVRTSTDP